MCQALWSFSLIPTPYQTRGMNFSVCKGSIVPRYGSAVTSQLPTFPPAVTPSTCCQVALEESSEWFPAPGDIKAGSLPVPILLTECTTGRYQWRQVFCSLDNLGRILVHGRGAPWPGWGGDVGAASSGMARHSGPGGIHENTISTQASIHESIHPSIYSFISWTHQESFEKFCLSLEQCTFIQNHVQQVKCFTNHLSIWKIPSLYHAIFPFFIHYLLFGYFKY